MVEKSDGCLSCRVTWRRRILKEIDWDFYRNLIDFLPGTLKEAEEVLEVEEEDYPKRLYCHLIQISYSNETEWTCISSPLNPFLSG